MTVWLRSISDAPSRWTEAGVPSVVKRNSLVELLLDFGSIVRRRLFEFVSKLRLTSDNLLLYVCADHGGTECGEGSQGRRVEARICAQDSVYEAAECVANLVDLPGELDVVEAGAVKMYARAQGLGRLEDGEWGRVVVGRCGSRGGACIARVGYRDVGSCVRAGGRELCKGGAFGAERSEEAIDTRRGEMRARAGSHVYSGPR